MPDTPVSSAAATEVAFTPCLEMVGETLLRDDGDGMDPELVEFRAAALRLSFEYAGVRVPASDPSPTVLVGVATSLRAVERDWDGERMSRRMLERFGPQEIDELDVCARTHGASVDYVVDLDGDPTALVSFSRDAVPALRAAGWRVEMEADYPCELVTEAKFVAKMAPDPDDEEAPSWFELELGVEVDGRRIDLLPILVDLLEKGSSVGSLGAVCRTGRSFMALPLGEDRYLAVPPDRVKTLIRVVQELYELEGAPKGGPLKIPRLLPKFLDEVEQAFGGALAWEGEVSAVHKRRTAQRQLSGDLPPPEVEEPGSLKATLRPYQREGLAWLQNLSAHGAGGVLADDMGLGKTLQTIAHVCAEQESGRMERPVLVVAPTSLVGNWKRELKKFAPHLKVAILHGSKRHRLMARLDHAPNGEDPERVHVAITTYGLVVRDLEAFQARDYHLLVLDEAQAIKNPRGKAHHAVSTLEAELRLCISGTPVENNLEELWSLFDFLNKGMLGSQMEFRARYRDPIERWRNEERLDQLRRRIAPYVLRRMKSVVAGDLPPKTEIVETVELEEGQRELYESIRISAHAQVRGVIRKKGIANSAIDVLSALTKLRQVCCDPRLVDVQAARGVEQSAKLERLMEMLQTMLPQGRRVLIFSQFTSMLALIGEALQARGTKYVALTGASGDRQALCDDFEGGKADVFLISLKAGGTGLNLVSADTVIHYDPWWNPAAQAQATDRAYRIGQTKPVFVYNLVVSGSVEERMLGLQRKKQSLADNLLGQAGPGGLTEADVDDLFGKMDE